MSFMCIICFVQRDKHVFLFTRPPINTLDSCLKGISSKNNNEKYISENNFSKQII